MSHKSLFLRDFRPELDGGRNRNATDSYQYDYLNRKKDPEKAAYSGGSYPKSYSSSFLLTSPHDRQQSNLTTLDQKMDFTGTWKQHPEAFTQDLDHVVRETSGLAEPRTDTHRQHPAASPQNPGPVDRETLGLSDSRSNLRKLLDFLLEMRDHDLEKCLNDYKMIMESTDPQALTREVRYLF